MELTILIPCLNEEGTIEECINNAMMYLNQSKIAGEVLVVDNGSSDESVRLAQSAGARVISTARRGYGAALQYGIENSLGTYVIMGDADASYDFSDIDVMNQMLGALKKGTVLVVGNRMNDQMEKGAMPFAHRYIGVPFLSALGRCVYKTDVKDFHCGLRGVNREEFIKCGCTQSGMEYATEMIGRVACAGGKIAQVDIHFKKDHRGGPSHLNSIRDGFRHLKLLYEAVLFDKIRNDRNKPF